MRKKTKKKRIKRGKLPIVLAIMFALLLLCYNNGIPSFIRYNFLTSLLGMDGRFVVCIDPGHGAYDTGTHSPDGILEKDIVLKLGLEVGRILEKSGVKVIYTRKDDKTILGGNEREDLKKRVKISNDNNADLFVSLHCNRCDKPDVRGIEIWCNDPNTKSESLAVKIRDELYKLNYTVKRDIKYKADSSLYVLRNTKATAALVEVGYLSNESDKRYISSSIGQLKCAEAIAKAILDSK